MDPIDLCGLTECCRTQSRCQDRTIDINGQFCPDASECPVKCNDHCHILTNKTSPIANNTHLPNEYIIIDREDTNHKLLSIKTISSMNDTCDEFSCPMGLDDIGCKRSTICIKKETDIDGNVCQEICPAPCHQNQTICAEDKRDEFGCRVQETCRNKTKNVNGEFCSYDSICPAICNATQVLCETGIEDTGCRVPDVCYQPEKDINGDFCPFECPGICTENQVLCSGHPFDLKGCKGQPACYNRTLDHEGKFCPDASDCPIFCNESISLNQTICPTGVDDTGCKTPAICVIHEKDSSGEYCPFHCPEICNDNQVKCAGHKMDLKGCEGQSTCHNRTIDNDGDFCPEDSDCPVFCLENEVRCPGGVDGRGCKISDVCIPEERDANGTLCPVQHCPLNCNQNETYCEGWTNAVGCRENDTCHPRGVNFGGELCPEKCPVHCNATEVECEGQIQYGNGTNAGCRGEDICRPKSISEITGEFCSEKSDSHGCPITCPDFQVLCPAKKDNAGCLEPAFCFNKTTSHDGDYCPEESVCPTICLPDQVCCYIGIDETGCTKPDICMEKELDVNGEFCPFHCPGVCTEDEVQCEGHKKDILGCTEQPSCYNKTLDNNGTFCTDDRICPRYCELDEYKCPVKAPENGCNVPEECIQQEIDIYGELCPFHCPEICFEDQVLCPGHPIDEQGCTGQPQCYNRTTNKNETTCSDISICPTYCEPDEMLCEQGIDHDGCRKPGLCIKQEMDINGDLCPFQCPSLCAEDQVMCAGYRDELGCKKPEMCIGRQNKTKGTDIGGLCPGFCPAECMEHEVLCPSHLDCDGCPTDETCWPAARDLGGRFCDVDDLTTLSCPLLCNEEIGETLCPTNEPLWECKPMAICINRTKDYNGNYCHSHSVCPRRCEDDEIHCDDGMDSLGCKNVDLCLAKGRDITGNFCPRSCPPKCNDTQILCRGMKTEIGCQDQDSCIEKESDLNGLICPGVCPIECDETQVLIPGGRDHRNCSLPDTCIGKI